MEIAAVIRLQRSASAASCFRPAAVNRVANPCPACPARRNPFIPNNFAFRKKVRWDRPLKVFVVMQFGPQFDHVWRHVVEKTIEQEGFWPIRVDQVYGPNPIIEDIKRLIEEVRIVIGEITPANANVFYKIGYADALRKPLILLAQEGTKLPFDLGGARMISYRDQFGAEQSLVDNLTNSLHACCSSFDTRTISAARAK